MFDNLIIKI